MTENEAINIIFAQAECETKEHICDKDKCDECELLYMQGTVKEHREALQMAINALSEIQQYRAIGTIEEFKALKEKSVAKKPLLRLCGDCQRGCTNCDRYEDRCPTCNGGLYVESGKPHEHCPHCGQKLDWQ